MKLPSQIIEAPFRLLGEYKVDCVIVGGIAATIHGSSVLTNDLDVCYSREPANLKRLAEALQSVHARLRNAPDKRAAGRQKDLLALPELEAIQEAQAIENKTKQPD